MNKTVSIQAYNRPNKLKRCINILKKAKGIENWDIYGFVDGNGDSEVRQIMLDEVAEGTLEKVSFFDKNYGIRKANIKTLDYMFDFSDFNCHIEEDILISEDCLKFFDDCYELINNMSKVMSVTGWSHPNVNKQSNRFLISQRFSCWSWCTTQDIYNKHFKKAFDQYYYDDSWACSVSDYYEGNDLYELFPEMSRVRNIGFDSGYHDGSDNSLQDELDKWTGGKFTPTYDNLFCSDSNCEVAIKHQEGG